MTTLRFQPYSFHHGKVAKNRVVVPPMASQTADENGDVTAKTIEHYAHLAQSGAGIIFVEYSFIHSSGKGEAHQLGIDQDHQVEGLKKVVREIHKTGALAGMQIVHVGGKSKMEITGQTLLAPSAVKVPVQGWEPDLPRAMTTEEIPQLIDWYVQGAKRVAEAGFDFAELHAAHGYGFNQWLSPLTNQRQDEFGGNLEKRSQLLFQVAEKIKQQIPELLLAVRLLGQDYLQGGLTQEDMVWVALQLQDRGVDVIDVSSGLGGWRRRDQRTHEGYLIADAAHLKSHLKIPVIGVGGIQTGDFIDQVIEGSQVDFAAVGRAILKDPKLWKEINLECFDQNKCQASSF